MTGITAVPAADWPIGLAPGSAAVATTPEQSRLNPRALGLDEFATEVMDLLQTDPTPHEILVKGVLMHRWAERDGTYDELVAQRSQALAMLPGRQ